MFCPGLQVKPILENSTIFLIPCTLATDGMSLKPGLQFDRLTELVGLLFPVTLSYTKDNPEPDPTTLHDSFVLKANALVITSLDNKLSLPVGNDYTAKKIDGNTVKLRVMRQARQLQICLNCLMTATQTEMSVIKESEFEYTSECKGRSYLLVTSDV